MNKIKTIELFDVKNELIAGLFEECEYPWEIVPRISDYIKKLVDDGIEGFKLLKEGVLIGKDVKIYPTATICAPTIICDGAQIRPGAFIRGNVFIGKNAVVGNSSEVKNSVVSDKAQIPHYNYVGDSVLGEGAHMGAGAICSNLKADGKNIIIHAEKDYETGLRKLGAILGDNADIGCGSVLNPGTIIGKRTRVYPLTALRGVYESDSIVKGQNNIVKIN